MISYGFLPLIAAAQITVSGSIHPNAIEIDTSANVHPGSASIKNPGATLDWVKDDLLNTDTPSLIDSIATGIKTTAPNQTGAAGGKGHWNGVRIVDGFGGGDQDIFTKGGKVNEPLSWVIAPGSIGSSKYDATQMYIANNQTDIFFGMERNGNNGTTAFDWEFNQLPPLVFVDDPATTLDETTLNGYVPDRSDGDILITFEMQGSGGASGTVQTYIFRFNGTTELYAPYCDDDPGTSGTGQGNCMAGLLTSINGISPTPAEPWGYVNGGSWILTPGFPLRFMAEAKVPLSLLPGVNTCGGSGFVAVRTRASNTLGSDAKDTTKIFEYNFGGPLADGELSSGCGLDIDYDAAGSANSSGGTTGLSYEWFFQKLVAGSWVDVNGPGADATGVSGTFAAPDAGTYRANLRVTQDTACFDDVITNSVTVAPDVGGSALLVGDCDDTFSYSATGSGGSGRYSFFVRIYKVVNGADVLAHEFSQNSAAEDNAATTEIDERTTVVGTLDIDSFNVSGDGAYKATVTVSDFNDTDCTFPASTNTIQVRHPLTVLIAKSLALSSTNVNMVDGSFSVHVFATLGNEGSDTITKQWKQFISDPETGTNVGSDSLTLTRTMAEIISAGSIGGEETTSILGDTYKVRRASLQLRLTVSRTLNGQNCPVNSNNLTVKALKGIDP